MSFIIDQLSTITSSNRGTNTPGQFLYRTQDTKSTVTTANYFVEGYTQVAATDTTFTTSSVALRTIDRFQVGDIIEVQRVNSSDVPQEFFTIYVATIDYDGTSPAMTVIEFEDSDTVTGPASSTDNTIVRFDGTTGTAIQGSSVVISDADAVSGLASLNINSTTTIDGIIDDDTMATASATKAATSESIVAYADSVGVQDATTSEVQLNYTINGDTVYQKIVDIGALPNNTTSTDAHGITGLDTVWDFRIVVDNATNQICFSGYWTDGTLDVEAHLTDTNIAIATTGDMSGYSGYGIIIYSTT